MTFSRSCFREGVYVSKTTYDTVREACEANAVKPSSCDHGFDAMMPHLQVCEIIHSPMQASKQNRKLYCTVLYCIVLDKNCTATLQIFGRSQGSCSVLNYTKFHLQDLVLDEAATHCRQINIVLYCTVLYCTGLYCCAVLCCTVFCHESEAQTTSRRP